jgi:hypothetical protein
MPPCSIRLQRCKDGVLVSEPFYNVAGEIQAGLKKSWTLLSHDLTVFS